ncbi:sensor histidine kinase [Actinoplanes sp. KI2]|uniref:sensor histidine kinase n=1 Tax=Actinoplanes sp. KI2 TaxID=2983315 RepID=UPI0021D5DF60|nr:sensor histidine kinase [Actinoplanes sp. KI2]MCU7728271.1 sensor histidine kinase [Actinoplanes sp. KI2]
MVVPLRWMASVLYAAVLVTGVYYALAGLAPDWSTAALMVFVATLIALLGLEQVARRHATERRWAIGLLIVRMVLFEVATATDKAGFARVLYVLVPFFAYFSLGRRWSIGLAGAYLVAGVVRASFTPSWWTDPEIVSDLLMFFIGMLLSVVTAAVAAEQQRSRERAERLVGELSASQRRLADYAGRVAELSAATERNRLARDIHDSVGHHLTAISVQLAKAEAFRERDPAVADRAVGDARRAAGRALQEVRESVGTLRASPFGLTTAIAALADGLDDAGFRVSLEFSGSEAGHGRPEREALYRVAQEALTNARRHAGADLVRVALRFGPAATLEVCDNGRGFTLGEVGAGSGLAGMRERLAALGGTFLVDSTPGHGTRVTASIPGER